MSRPVCIQYYAPARCVYAQKMERGLISKGEIAQSPNDRQVRHGIVDLIQTRHTPPVQVQPGRVNGCGGRFTQRENSRTSIEGHGFSVGVYSLQRETRRIREV